MVIIFSLCWPLILLHHVQNGLFPLFSHVSLISARFQLALFPRVGQVGPLTPLFLPIGFRKLWIQSTAVYLSGTGSVPTEESFNDGASLVAGNITLNLVIY
jgi:hypothetical protein